MKIIIFNLIIVLGVVAVFTGCDRFEEEEFELGAVPTTEDAIFTYVSTPENANIITFSSSGSGFIYNWDLGNGKTAQGKTVTGVYPLKGDYEITLTVYSDGGSVSSSQIINIAQTNPILLDIPVYNMLTGGADQPEGKTWVIDKFTAGHFGLGPITEYAPIWYSAGANEKEGSGLYNDTYTFKLDGFSYDWVTNGDVYLNGAYTSDFPGATASPVGDFTAPYEAPENLTWSLTEVEDGYNILSISPGKNFIGYYAGATSYDVLELTEEKMSLRFIDEANQFSWYLTLIPEGFTPPPPPPPATSNMPIDFEGTTAPPFNGFGGSTYQVIDNPDATGINTSDKVGEYIKGTEANWAGIETILSDYLDFSTNTLIKYKVYSPVAGRALFKLESQDGTATPIEVFADVTKLNEWEELTFDFSAAASGTYNKIAIFLDFDNNNGGTFYLDDIHQASIPAELTMATLTGDGSKTWILKPGAGSYGVGPAKGDISWWPGATTDVSTERPCLFNDEFIFKSSGEYEYNAAGDVYTEPYMADLAAGCSDESELMGTAAEAWASGTHNFTLEPATDSSPAYITVTGTGAFIALPKAYNGGEYQTAPPTADASVKYEVLEYVKNGDNETMKITIDISGNGTGFWSFVLVAQ